MFHSRGNEIPAKVNFLVFAGGFMIGGFDSIIFLFYGKKHGSIFWSTVTVCWAKQFSRRGILQWNSVHMFCTGLRRDNSHENVAVRNTTKKMKTC